MIRNFPVILDVLTWHRMYMFPFWRKFHCEGKRDFFLPKANYTMKNLLNSLRPFFKFAKFSFGAESQWSILKNFIRKMACSLTHLKKWDSFLNQSQSKIAHVFFHLFMRTFLQKLWWCLAILAELGIPEKWFPISDRMQVITGFYPLQFPKGSNKFQIMV